MPQLKLVFTKKAESGSNWSSSNKTCLFSLRDKFILIYFIGLAPNCKSSAKFFNVNHDASKNMINLDIFSSTTLTMICIFSRERLQSGFLIIFLLENFHPPMQRFLTFLWFVENVYVFHIYTKIYLVKNS